LPTQVLVQDFDVPHAEAECRQVTRAVGKVTNVEERWRLRRWKINGENKGKLQIALGLSFIFTGCAVQIA
jgi:hypothetical protein